MKRRLVVSGKGNMSNQVLILRSGAIQSSCRNTNGPTKIKFSIAFILGLGLALIGADVFAQEKTNPWPSLIGGPNNNNDGRRSKVASGNAQAAEAYYQRLEKEIGFPNTNLNGLIGYLGYSKSARDIETIKPISVFPNLLGEDSLGDLQRAGDVLVSRFFAPKIVNYHVSASRYDAGWRKLVYLRSKVNSTAYLKGISGAYVLFNYFQTDPNADPFGGSNHSASANNQVILIPNFELNGKPRQWYIKDKVDAAYFAVYGGNDKGYPIINTLKAGFDIPLDGPLKEYAVPNACAHCHGQNGGEPDIDGERKVFSHVKPNYLDSDQWYDAELMDFPAVLKGPFDPVYDGGRNHKSAQYRRAMDTLEKINRQIKKDGRFVETEARSGVDKWLQLRSVHGDVPVPLVERGLDGQWVNNLYDKELLGMLSQNCFRCHGSIKYNVFEKKAVKDRSQNIPLFLDSGYMPEGRTLPERDKACLIALVERLETGNSTTVDKECWYRFCPADFDQSGTVDIADHSMLLINWGTCKANSDCVADLNSDGVVSTSDIADLFVAWGACPQPGEATF